MRLHSEQSWTCTMDSKKDKIVCDPCRFRDKKVIANYFCQHCMEYYCKQCRKQHLKFRLTMGHSVRKRTQIWNELSTKDSTVDLCPKQGPGKYSNNEVGSNLDAYDFEGDILENDASKHCHLSGKCSVRLDRCSIAITEVTNHVTITWPFTCIRKYGSMDDKIFFFESGRRSGAGEGRYILLCHDAVSLHRHMTNFIRLIERNTHF